MNRNGAPRAPARAAHVVLGATGALMIVAVVVAPLVTPLVTPVVASVVAAAGRGRPGDAGAATIASGRAGSRLPFGAVADPGVVPGAVAPVTAPGRPVRLRIPAIGVDTRLESLGLQPDGALAAPHEWAEAGWYAAGVVPGQLGPAVIAGHVDSTTGPAVFFRLRQLRQGDQVLVTDAGGRVRRFVVDGAQRFPKTRFATSAVYAATPDAELRLVTCTGDFDATRRSYVDNLVVSAHLSPG